ncbi:hypothetical protein QKW60_03475 [Defluviimonas aestuarii]|nr:hypothetical protein [Defluviimonas aestuarii]
MTQPNEIRDVEALIEWLETRHPEEAAIIALRAVLRLMPLLGAAMSEPWVNANNASMLPALRLGLWGMVMVHEQAPSYAYVEPPDPRAEKALYQIAETANRMSAARVVDVARVAADAADAAASFQISNATASELARSARHDAAKVIRMASEISLAGPGAMAQLRADADSMATGASLYLQRLWTIERMPSWFVESERAMRRLWELKPDTWGFWGRWWDGVSAGKPVNYLFQRDVVCIRDVVWQQGPDAIAEAIAGIDRPLLTHPQIALAEAIRENPFALRIDVDAGSASLVADELREFDLSDIIDAVAASMRDFTRRTAGMMTGNQPGFALRETVNPAVKELRRDLKRYADSPLKLHDAIGDAIQEVVASARREGVQSEPVLQRLIGAWTRQQTDLCGTCPELLEMIRRRTMVQVKLFTEAELRQALTLGQGLHDRSSGYLRVATAWALKTIKDPSRPKEELQSAWYFLAAVLPRGADAAIRFEEGRKSAKEGGVAKKIKDVADIAVAGDKIVDVAQENASEIWDFGHWVASEIMSGNWFGNGGGLG